MKRGVVRIGGLVMLELLLSAAAASAQNAAGGTPQRRWSLEGAAGVQLDYTGTMQGVAFGFAPTRSLTLLIGAERSRTDDEIEFYPDGYASERGGLVEFVSAVFPDPVPAEEVAIRGARDATVIRGQSQNPVWRAPQSARRSQVPGTQRAGSEPVVYGSCIRIIAVLRDIPGRAGRLRWPSVSLQQQSEVFH